jgi:hypothetical protein
MSILISDERVDSVVKKFEQTLSDCPADSKPRQRVTTEFKDNAVFVFITTSFKFNREKETR